MSFMMTADLQAAWEDKSTGRPLEGWASEDGGPSEET